MEAALGDFQAGQDVVTEVLELKLTFLKLFPVVSAGLAHHDEEKAKKLAVELMNRFDEFPDIQLYHRNVCRIFAKDFPGSIRAAVEAWAIQNVSLEQLPDLKLELSKLRCMPFSEREVEAEHSK